MRYLTKIIGSLCAALALSIGSPRVQAANANPPGKVTYQGFLTDQNGAPLGASSPVNETVVFRIYTAATGGTLKWTEQQTVTIDNGHFSVLLGEGSRLNSEPTASDLTAVFAGADASDRFMQISIGANTILPRIQYFPAPFAMLAMNARALVDPNGATILSTAAGAVGINKSGTPASTLDVGGTITGTGLTINGAATVSGAFTSASFNGGGAGLTGLNASQLITGILPDGRLSGTYGSAVTLNNTGNTLAGNGANLTALNANNLASGTVADARLSANVTGAVTLANGATSANTANQIVRRSADGTVSVGTLSGKEVSVTGKVSADVVTARAMDVREGVNNILPPYVVKVGDVNNTINWHSAVIPSEIVKSYLGGDRGGRMVIKLHRASDDEVRNAEYLITIEHDSWSGNKVAGRAIGALSPTDGNTWAIMNNGSKWSLFHPPWNYIWCHNYHHENTDPKVAGAAYTDYKLELLTHPNVTAVVVLYNF